MRHLGRGRARVGLVVALLGAAGATAVLLSLARPAAAPGVYAAAVPATRPAGPVSLVHPMADDADVEPAHWVARADLPGDGGTVEFLANGRPIGKADAPPYSIAWTDVPAGEYALTATARGADGVLLSTSPPVTVRVVAAVAGRTYRVAPTGADDAPGDAARPLRTIARAAELAGPGDRVLIADGTYRESVRVGRSGEPGRPITFEAEHAGKAVIDAAGLPVAFAPADGAAASHVTLRGVVVRNCRNEMQASHAAVRTGDGWRLDGVTVERADGQGIGVLGNRVTVLRSTARLNGQAGIGGGASHALVADCTTAGNNTRGIDPGWEAGGGKWTGTDGLYLLRVTAAENVGPGIWLDWRNTNYVIDRCTVTANKGRRNGWEGAGIVVEISPGPGRIESNVCRANTGDGVGVWESMRVLVRDNTLIDNGINFRNLAGRGEYALGDVTVTGNRVRNASVGGNVGRFTDDAAAAARIRIDANTYDQPPGKTLIYWGGTECKSLADIRAELDWEHAGRTDRVPDP